VESRQPQQMSGAMQGAIAAFIVGVLFIVVPIAVSVIVGGEPFPGAVVGPSEVAPVIGMLVCIISTLIIVQELFGY
jgi:hypothetical protein